jgi:hypothetical protein
MTSITLIASLFANGAWLVGCAFLAGVLGVGMGLYSKGGSEIGEHCYGKPQPRHGSALDREELRAWTRGTR